MNINRKNQSPRGRSLCSVSPGYTVSFCAQFHQDHCLSDIFIVVNSNGYLDRYGDCLNPGKMCIVNIKTGKMSVVDQSRECHIVKGEFYVR